MNIGGQFRSFALARVPLPEGTAVHPHTAFLTYKASLVQDAYGQWRVGIFYEFGSPGNCELLQNWSFDIPYILDGRSLTMKGRTYLIGFDWVDTTGYSSGLKYINKIYPNVQLGDIWPSKNNPSGLTDLQGYQLNQPNGVSVFFDAGGKPTFEQYRDGIRIHRFLHEIKFVTFDIEGVTAIKDGAGHSTLLKYEPFVDMKAISRVVYPTGASSRHEYSTSEFRDQIQQHTEYMLSRLVIDYTFTDFMIGLKMAGNTDSLMNGDDDALNCLFHNPIPGRYDVVQTSYDKDWNATSQTITWFNKCHLPTEIIRWKSDGKDLKDGWKTTYSYGIPVDDGARTTNFERPDFAGNVIGHWISSPDLLKAEYDEQLKLASSYVW
ncbi:hypothetical protein N7478_011848 [Penicillium angulare]|uniref:uncharacterized protein n=1 Tax=Penicillium angulare TaxID=116970 RepID=UPI00253FE100|nr:uncharacterized protein N7478_011848 [Penicillium angulare]KAJ5261253.1 hypothetical protein N7478_011848 [Penicillium angulare]